MRIKRRLVGLRVMFALSTTFIFQALLTSSRDLSGRRQVLRCPPQGR
jgi:hypothetical protein